MPTPTYRHNCWWKGGREVESPSNRCWYCWKKSEPYKWEWGVIEQWWRFQKRTGLSPLHPKPPEIMAGQITRVCGRCNGGGFAPSPERRIPICPECDGAGGFPVLEKAALDHARAYARQIRQQKIDEVLRRKAAREKEWEDAVTAARRKVPGRDP